MTMIQWLYRHHRLDRLEEKLTQIEKHMKPLSIVRKANLKKRVMFRIDQEITQEEVSFEQLAEELEKLTLMVEPTSAFKVSTRRDLLDVLTLRDQRIWIGDLIRDLFGRRRTWATASAFLVLFVSMFGYLTQLPQVSAAKVSSVTSVSGSAYVVRNGTSLEVQLGTLIQEGDVINTDADGWVDILFVDDSLVTMGPNTIASIAIWSDPNNETKSSIELNVERGRVWSNVVNLLSKGSSFTVTSGDAAFSVERKGTFDIFVSEDSFRVRVFDQLVDFNIEQGALVQEGTLGPELLMQFKDGTLLIEKIEDLDVLVSEDVWVQTNLQNHENHLAHLDNYYHERAEQQAGILPGDVRYFAKRSLEEIQLFLTLDDEVYFDRAIKIADTRFSEAVLLTNQGRAEEAGKVLEDYQNILFEVSEIYSSKSVEQILEANKKLIDGVSPEQYLEDLREVISETSVLVADDDATRNVLQLETAADRLGLALDFLEIGAYDLAKVSLEDYQAGLKEVLDSLPDLEMEARKEVILKILDQKLRDLEMLKLIAAELEALTNGEREASEAVQVQMESVYDETLYQLNTLVINLKERAVLELTTFLEDVKYDQVVQQEVLDRLKRSVELEFEFIQLINDLESFYADEGEGVLIFDETLFTSSIDKEIFFDDYQEGTVQGTVVPDYQEAGTL